MHNFQFSIFNLKSGNTGRKQNDGGDLAEQGGQPREGGTGRKGV